MFSLTNTFRVPDAPRTEGFPSDHGALHSGVQPEYDPLNFKFDSYAPKIRKREDEYLVN